MVWIFQGTKYYEDRTQRQYVGGSHGASVRIARGIYYRTSAFRGRAVDTTQTVLVGTGILAITTKNIYFAGPKSFRLPHAKVVVIEPFQDGVGIHRDAASARVRDGPTEW